LSGITAGQNKTVLRVRKVKEEIKEKPKSQKQRFIETAKDLECDESEEAFEDSFSHVVPPKSGTKGDGEDEKA